MADEIQIAPTVNMGGTSRKELLEGYCYALEALRRTETNLHQIVPHGRDYPGNTLAYFIALRQHHTRTAHIERIIQEITTLAHAVKG